jgi:hypothetical protein
MKRTNKVVSLEYLQKLVKKQEEKEEREKKIIVYVDEFTSNFCK